MSEQSTRPKLLNIIVSDSAIIGPEGKPTVYGIFNRINVKQLPTTHPMFSILMILGYGKAGHYSMCFSIISPSNKKIVESPENKFELQNERSIHNALYVFQGFSIQEEGEYRVVITLGGDVLPLDDRTLFFVEKR